MRSSGPHFPPDPSPGAKFGEFPKASEEGGHALTTAELQLLRGGGAAVEVAGVLSGSGPRSCGRNLRVTLSGEAQRPRVRPQGHAGSHS